MIRGPVPEAERLLLVQRCKDLARNFYGIVPTHWDPLGWSNDSMELAMFRRLQVTPCARAVRVGQVVEHYADYAGDRMLALRYAICRAALA